MYYTNTLWLESKSYVINSKRNNEISKWYYTGKCRTILEYIGATISNVYGWRFKKFLTLKGKGNTGKSVLLDLVIFILGLDNIFASDIKKLHSNFGLAGAYGKRLICCGDMKFASLAEIDIIKELTGGDFVNLEAKYQNSFTTKYKGLMWFNCNDLPKFSRR